jgi:hypothetical protein
VLRHVALIEKLVLPSISDQGDGVTRVMVDYVMVKLLTSCFL